MVRFEDANIYQTWPYGAVRWGENNLSHLLLRRGDEPVAMAQVIIVRPPHLRAGMAHLRWGPMFHLKGRAFDAEIARHMSSALYREYVQKQGLFLRILPNAYLKSTRAHIFRSTFEHFHSEPFLARWSYRTFDIDLTPSLEDLRMKLKQKWRNHLNKAERNGLTVKEDNGAKLFPVFIQLFNDMLARKKLEKVTEVEEFEQIQQLLPMGYRMQVFICEQDGVPIAGTVGSVMGDTGIYLFGAANEQGRKAQGSYMLQWRMIQWFKKKGAKHYDLGGINPDTNPGVYSFKRGLSGDDVHYMNPLVSCDSVASKVLARAVDLAGREMLTPLKRFFTQM
jgi:lipid II:glycine glycyltransferase (peptidoglycan interpeptide bridge formation enzyme)